ncbi:MAG: SUF system Fe-S cluster assembly regulator [Planctomycetia bacterium]
MLRITRQTDYGIVLLARFASLPPGTVRNAKDLAAEEGLPAPMASKILKLLGRSGLLASHRGATGGYSLARPAREISVADIIAALEGPIALTECLGAQERGCAISASCPTRPNWARINQAIAGALAGVHLDEMLPGAGLASASLASSSAASPHLHAVQALPAREA